MTIKTLLARPAAWWTIAAILAAIFMFMATNNEVYEIASPPSSDWSVMERKSESIVAFALVGFAVVRACFAGGRTASPLVIGAVIAAYSAVIEVMQYFLDPPWEGIWWSLFDVFCGFVGGYLAVYVVRLLGRTATPRL